MRQRQNASVALSNEATRSLTQIVARQTGSETLGQVVEYEALALRIAVIEVHGWGSGEGKNELLLYFLAAAFVPKAIQKFAEGTR